MSKFLVFGSSAWDRPIWLDRPLKSGGRLLGLMQQNGVSDLPSGRLGGGGANAASCLRNAGHEVAIYAPLRNDNVGEEIRTQLMSLDITTDYLVPVDPVRGETIVLIEPEGERTIIFLHSDTELDKTARRIQKRHRIKVDREVVSRYSPAGIYIRSIYEGIENLAGLSMKASVGHWPQSVERGGLPVDVLITSMDDLRAAGSGSHAFSAGQSATGGRLKWMIITEGAKGGRIINDQSELIYESPTIEQADSTGAGDSFAAGVLEAMVCGADIVEAAQHGAMWGATTATLKGCAQKRPPNTYRTWLEARTR